MRTIAGLTAMTAGALLLLVGESAAWCGKECANIAALGEIESSQPDMLLIAQKTAAKRATRHRKAKNMSGTQSHGSGGGAGAPASKSKPKLLNPQPEPPGRS
jgi:hypothetical protein